MPDLFYDDPIHFDAKLHPIVAGADSSASGQLATQGFCATDCGPSREALQDSIDTATHHKEEPVDLGLSGGRDYYPHHWPL
jgi:hypothetical protein